MTPLNGNAFIARSLGIATVAGFIYSRYMGKHPTWEKLKSKVERISNIRIEKEDLKVKVGRKANNAEEVKKLL